MNDDLWKNPFDDELEGFVAAFRDLLVPIIEDVQRFGLKARHLRKHRGGVDSRSWKRTMYHGITTPQKEHFVIWLCSEKYQARLAKKV